MPVITAKYRQIVCVSKLKKMYSVLSQAMLFTVQKDGDYSSLTFSDSGPSVLNWYNEALKPYIKVTKECYESAGCWHTSGPTKYLNGNTATYDRGDIGVGYGIVVFNTMDGYAVDMDGYSASDASNRFGVNVTSDTLAIYVDVNGKGNPNIIGKDIYVFVFSDKGFVPAGHDRTDSQVNSDCSKTGTGQFCFEKIIRNSWQIDKENLW